MKILEVVGAVATRSATKGPRVPARDRGEGLEHADLDQLVGMARGVRWLPTVAMRRSATSSRLCATAAQPAGGLGLAAHAELGGDAEDQRLTKLAGMGGVGVGLSISPGSSVWPAPSMTVAPAGTASVGRTALIASR